MTVDTYGSINHTTKPLKDVAIGIRDIGGDAAAQDPLLGGRKNGHGSSSPPEEGSPLSRSLSDTGFVY